jgi:microcystin-dependent protein
MSTAYIGEIRAFGFGFAPPYYVRCDGQSLPVTGPFYNLYLVIGTLFGGDGENSFCVPNIQSRVIAGMGTDPNGVAFPLGQLAGQEQVTLDETQVPQHSHDLIATSQSQVPTILPKGNFLGIPTAQKNAAQNFPIYASNFQDPITMAAGAVGTAGADQAHENRQPFLAVNYCIRWGNGFLPSAFVEPAEAAGREGGPR